jgi:hypothetical protein
MEHRVVRHKGIEITDESLLQKSKAIPVTGSGGPCLLWGTNIIYI